MTFQADSLDILDGLAAERDPLAAELDNLSAEVDHLFFTSLTTYTRIDLALMV